jgi:hypothetical protein
MVKIVPSFRMITTIFYLIFFELRKILFGLVKICIYLKLFKNI